MMSATSSEGTLAPEVPRAVPESQRDPGVGGREVLRRNEHRANRVHLTRCLNGKLYSILLEISKAFAVFALADPKVCPRYSYTEYTESESINSSASLLSNFIQRSKTVFHSTSTLDPTICTNH